MLGVRPQLDLLFRADEDLAGAAGVVPELFEFPESSEIWIPLAPTMAGTPRTARAVAVMGRMKPGVTVAQADRELAAVSKAVNTQYGVGETEFVGFAGSLPALQASKGRLHETLKDGARGAGGGLRSNRVRSGLVIAEVGLSLVLLVGASLFMRAFMALQNTAVGFDTNPVMTMRCYLPGLRYDSTTAKVAGVQDILRRVEAIPNVQSATISNLIPLEDGGAGDRVIIDGVDVEQGE